MHKIKKGIKKKIKGKKGKHDDDEIFTEEELEQYKREKAEEAQRLAQQHQLHSEGENYLDENIPEEEFENEAHLAEASHSEESAAKSEETDWKSFLASTDTVLKKTSDNLEHIKESSYFQARKPEKEELEPEAVEPLSQKESACVSPVPFAQSTNWVDLDKGGLDDEREDVEVVNQVEVQFEPPAKKKFVELKPIEDLPELSAEDYADVFDTAFVEDIEKGDLKLIIPDSPVDEFANEPDPFDTSVADRVLHKEEPKPGPELKVTSGFRNKNSEPPKKRKIQLVSLGNAVDVLTGKASPNPKSEQVDDIDLLGEFSEHEKDKKEPTESDKENNVSADEGDNKDTEDRALDKNLEKEKELDQPSDQKKKNELDDILFGIEEPTDNLPEFVIPVKEKEHIENFEKEESKLDIEEFLPKTDLLEEQTLDNKTLDLNDLVSEFDVVVKDNSSVEDTLVPNTTEDPILDEFDAEFASLAHESIAKAKDKEIEDIGLENEEDDPFDTSYVVGVVEVNSNTETGKDLDPFDISSCDTSVTDRKVPSRPPPPRPVTPRDKPDLLGDINLPVTEVDPFDTSIAENIIPVNHLEASENEDLADTLEPSLTKDTLSESESFDPFDTSAADAFGITELKVLENELLTESQTNLSGIKSSDSDFDFNPREGEESKENIPSVCLLSGESENQELVEDVLCPKETEKQVNEDDFDPFDTSIADKIQIETLEELVFDKEPVTKNSTVENTEVKKPKPVLPPRPKSPACLLITSPTSEDVNPALQPQSIDDISQKEDDEIDPFDTSIADAYGRTELKVLEEELLANSSSLPENKAPLKTISVEPTPSPKLEVKQPPKRPPSPACLLAATPVDENPTLVPQPKTSDNTCEEEDFDPFDTSIAHQFGKVELHVLESELLRPESQASTFSDFDPRAETPVGNNIENLTESEPSKPDPILISDTTDIDVPTIEPTPIDQSKEGEEIDPFDTSIADKLGSIELKNLESEFLENSEVPPAVEETKKERDTLSLNPAVSENQGHILSDNCLLATTPTDSSKTLQPLKSVEEAAVVGETEDFDPFDTSIANQFGKTEIKELEQELLTSSVSPLQPVYPLELKQTDISEDIDPFDTSIAEKCRITSSTSINTSLSDDDFDPRQEEQKTNIVDLLDSTESTNLPNSSEVVLQPQLSQGAVDIEEIDPFDTSIAAGIGLGKTELKILESELL